jgi:hypothetical protein
MTPKNQISLLKKCVTQAKKSRLPVLTGIQVYPDRVQVTDLDVWITFPRDIITAEAKDGCYENKSAGMLIAGFPVEPEWEPPEAPHLPDVTTHAGCLTDAFWHAYRALQPAFSDDETRWVLNAAGYRDGMLAGTDGRRLHAERMPDLPFKDSECVGHPAKMFAAFAAIAGETELFKSDVHYAADDGNVRCIWKAMDGTYPNFKQVVPDISALPVTVEFGDLSGAVAFAKAAKDREAQIRFGKDGHVLAGMTKLPWPSACTNAPAKALRLSYLVDCATFVGNTRFRQYDEASPILLGSDDGNRLAVQMPMRVE